LFVCLFLFSFPFLFLLYSVLFCAYTLIFRSSVANNTEDPVRKQQILNTLNELDRVFPVQVQFHFQSQNQIPIQFKMFHRI
jgi:hypothetical protein